MARTTQAQRRAAKDKAEAQKEQKRRRGAKSIKPGWTTMSKESWQPSDNRPRVSDLQKEICRRAAFATYRGTKPKPGQWDWSKCVSWLEQHAEEDVAGGESLVSLAEDSADAQDFSAAPLGPAAESPYRHTRSAETIVESESPAPAPKKNWSRVKMVPRLANVISFQKAVFLNRDANLSREQLDAKEADEPYHLLATEFNNDRNEFVNANQFIGDDDVPDEVRALNPDSYGYIISATKLKLELRNLRSVLEKAMAKFRTSGQGDGGCDLTSEEREGEVFSSSFVDFVGDDWALYCFYLVAVKYGLLKSALVTMPKEARHNGTSMSSTAQARQRKRDRADCLSEVSDALRAEVPVRVVLTEDQHAENAAKRRRAEIDATSASVKLYDDVYEAYAKTCAALENGRLSPFSQ